MKKILALGLLSTSLIFADAIPETYDETPAVTSNKAYVSLGLGPFPIPMPLFGIGGRFQNGHHGVDVSLQGVSFGRGFSVLKENIDYLYYFKPKLASQFYMGAGFSFTEVFTRKRCQSYLSPQFVIGSSIQPTTMMCGFFKHRSNLASLTSIKYIRSKAGEPFQRL